MHGSKSKSIQIELPEGDISPNQLDILRKYSDTLTQLMLEKKCHLDEKNMIRLALINDKVYKFLQNKLPRFSSIVTLNIVRFSDALSEEKYLPQVINNALKLSNILQTSSVFERFFVLTYNNAENKSEVMEDILKEDFKKSEFFAKYSGQKKIETIVVNTNNTFVNEPNQFMSSFTPEKATPNNKQEFGEHDIDYKKAVVLNFMNPKNSINTPNSTRDFSTPSPHNMEVQSDDNLNLKDQANEFDEFFNHVSPINFLPNQDTSSSTNDDEWLNILNPSSNTFLSKYNDFKSFSTLDGPPPSPAFQTQYNASSQEGTQNNNLNNLFSSISPINFLSNQGTSSQPIYHDDAFNNYLNLGPDINNLSMFEKGHFESIYNNEVTKSQVNTQNTGKGNLKRSSDEQEENKRVEENKRFKPLLHLR